MSCSNLNQLSNKQEVVNPGLPSPISLEYPNYKKVDEMICIDKSEYNKLYNNKLEVIRYLEQNKTLIEFYRKPAIE